MHTMIKKFFKDFNELEKYYRYLVNQTKQHKNVGIASEWLIDNYYLVVSYKNSIQKDKKHIKEMLKDSDNIYSSLLGIVIKYDYNISYKILVKELNTYQRKNKIYFSYKELSLVQILLYFIYTKKLKEEFTTVYNDLLVENEVSTIIKNINANKDFSNIFNDEKLLLNDSYIFELNKQMSDIEYASSLFFKELTVRLENNNKSLKNIVNDKYQEKINCTMIVSNMFLNIKDFIIYDVESIFEMTNQSEKILLEDNIYDKMTSETKENYRKKITVLAKKSHKSELEITGELMNKAKSEHIHIGFLLFPQKSSEINSILYILSILVISISMSVLLSFYFIPYKIIGTLLLLIPSIQLSTQIINQIVMKLLHPKALPKMNYLKGIPEEDSCMVVIPTIVSDVKKVKHVFDKLETYYLMNKSNNLYFTLLADVKKEDKKDMPYDKEIIDYGLSYVKELNKKYKKDIFHFVYRKRVFSSDEDAYLGYERKRGALLQFNRILLKKITDKEEEKYFNANTLKDFSKKMKYVITLDTDTEPVLNSLLKLIGCMAHPMNKPILNQKKNKVIGGYGIMQPRVSIDIEATNKSLFSQIFAGIGGFDTYSSLIPNIYQDLFREGSFVGKGIYDLEIFDKVLYNRFPNNLILSHDLLEGNYLRCGYISDVEIIDGFPSKFLVETSRNHRWARGDSQIIPFIFSKVKRKDGSIEKNPQNLIEKYKIIDNIIRIFLYPSLLIIFVITLFKKEYRFLFLLFILLVIAFPIITFLRSKLYVKKDHTKTVYYKDLVFGGKSLILRTVVSISTIPYYAVLYLDAFLKSIYRMTYSHKNLLSWTSSEDAEKKISQSLTNYIKNFRIQLIFSIVLFIIFLTSKNLIGMVFSLLFFASPLLTFYISLDLDLDTCEKLNSKENDEVEELARKTWNYFENYLNEENNYLIPDNYSDIREEKVEFRTSPTNIGYSLTSVICAYFLNFIDIDRTIFYLKKIISSVDTLEKWNGHLYNWYNTKTKEVLYPKFISSVDSGNLVAAFFITLEFLKENEVYDTSKIVENLINNCNFKKLYTKRDVLSIGFDVSTNQLSIYNYNKFASESRLTSFVAICKGDIPSKHWFCLDKSLTTYKKYKGLISWGGTSFEYYMPFLFMKNYKNTLLDETYQFAHICQKSYAEAIDKRLPFGISESAYGELDQGLNYKYRSFSVPYLTSKESINNEVVISPYSSLMEMSLYPKDVLKNIHKLKKLNMFFKYGFYDAYDYDRKRIARVCFSHHQGMILMGLTNYLKDDIMKEYFHSNIKIKAFEILLKEKVQIRANIDMKMDEYKKYNYEKEKIENDIRYFDHISMMPEVSVLSNGKYTTLLNDRGSGFSRYRSNLLNRYRKVTEQDYGIFLYVKDKNTNYIFSNTYAPVNKTPNKYEVVFASDKIKYFRKDGDLSTKTEIIVLENEHAEIRKVTFYNDSEEFKELELTTYTEPILSLSMQDVSHKVYNQMFLDIYWDNKLKALIAKRDNNDNEAPMYMVNSLIIDSPIDSYSYESDRFSFVGRGNSYANPVALNKKLTNHVGCNIEPILSIRNQIEVAPHSKKSVCILCGYGRSKKQIEELVSQYQDERKIKKAFKISNLSSITTTKKLNITGRDMRLYNILLNYLYQTTRISVSKNRQEILSKNSLNQSNLWRFGISGDNPMIVVNIKDLTNISFIMDILKAFEYFKNKSIFVDIIIINSEVVEYAKTIKKEIDDELYRIYSLNSFYNTPGNVVVVDKNDLNNEEMILFHEVARLYFDISENSCLEDFVNELQLNNKITVDRKLLPTNNIKFDDNISLDYKTSYGGFKNNGKEYVVLNKNTLTPWSNVISNESFGTIVTNNGCGYTFFENSLEFKITSWTNEMVINDKSEGIKINGLSFDVERCTHGFGYSILESEQKDLKTSITEFVAKDDPVKIYLVNIKNKESVSKNIELAYYINPVLGNFEEKTGRHILAEMNKEKNYMHLRNVYNIAYSDVSVFLSSSCSIENSITDRILVKEISTSISIDPNEEKSIVFMLGCSRNVNNIDSIIKKYNTVSLCRKALSDVKDNWDKKLSTIQIKTNDKSFDYMINGWYLYQTISSRIFARAGFYQVSGAYGYRDQLQDAMNICMVCEDYTKKQILINASHQFRQGDVLHWWHEKTKFGLRSRYKDDYLFLVYAVLRYIECTDDYKILDEQVPFIEGEELTKYEADKGITFRYSSDKESLYSHIILALSYSMNQLGSHGLPLMGGGDWNDGMNRVGIKGKGESVWLGFFLYMLIDGMIPIIKKYDSDTDISKYIEFNNKLKKSLNDNAFENDYYLRAYFDNGDKLGSADCSECKIDLISQCFSILSGVCDEKNYDKVLDCIDEGLFDHELNIVKLLSPPFKSSLNNPGYIMNYPTGIRENGGQYTHAVSWYIMALIKAHKYDLAYKCYQMINPINRTCTDQLVNEYKVEPYVIAADIYSNKDFKGRGGWTWYTGSAGWFYYVGIGEIIGLKRKGNILEISPSIPKEWDGFKVIYKYLDSTYNIEVIISSKTKLIIDNKEQKDLKIKLDNSCKNYNVKLYIERKK